MNQLEAFLEKTWDYLLSRDPHKIEQMYLSLDASSRHLVYAHLQKMVNEPGWQPEQVLSARMALQVIELTSKEK
jgi:hypothetical protein